MDKNITFIIICGIGSFIVYIFILAFYINRRICYKKEPHERLLYRYSEPTCIYNGKFRHDIESCSICLSPVTARENLLIKCNHSFHTKCIEAWTAKNIKNNKLPRCPNCNELYLELVN